MLQLRRITSSVAYIPEIDGIRFLAVLLVIFYHLSGDILRHSPYGYGHSLGNNPVFWLSQRGIFGIEMFFVVSGFVLALPFARSRLTGHQAPNLKRYYLRRLTRLEPPYIAALLLFFILKIAAGRGTASGLWPHLLASVFYQHNLIYASPSTIEFVAWTLEIEVQFYLLAPLIAALAFRLAHPMLRRGVLVIAILGCGLVARTLYPLSPRFQLSILCYLGYFLAGFLLADLYALEEGARETGSGWDAPAAAGLAAPFVWMYLALPMDYFGPLTLCAAYYAIFHSVAVRRFLSAAVISITGGMCYSIYLVHNYVLAACGFFSEPLTATLPFTVRFLFQSALMIPLVLAASTVFFVLIERPCMRPDWPRRLAGRLGFERGMAVDVARDGALNRAAE